MVSGQCYHGYESRSSFDADNSIQPRWMASIPDTVNITDLSIPGTHDTMTYNIGSETLQCQNWPLSVQLRAGIRYFDIRARLRDDELHIYHGSGYTGYSFEDVLKDMFAFLEDSPSETIIMRLKEESTPLGQNTKTFEQAFNYSRTESPATAPGAAKYFYLYDPSEAPIPTLGELRSKIFILQQFKTEETSPPYGLQWDGPQMELEDYWIVIDMDHLGDKWEAIRKSLEKTTTSPTDNSKLYLSHISASVGVLPIEAAAGSKDGKVEGMNDKTAEWLKEYKGEEKRAGIVILDFPGKDGIDQVLAWNSGL